MAAIEIGWTVLGMVSLWAGKLKSRTKRSTVMLSAPIPEQGHFDPEGGVPGLGVVSLPSPLATVRSMQPPTGSLIRRPRRACTRSFVFRRNAPCFQADDEAAAYKPPPMRRASSNRKIGIRFGDQDGSRLSPSVDTHARQNIIMSMFKAIVDRLAKDGLAGSDLFELNVPAHAASCHAEGFVYPDELGRFFNPLLGADISLSEITGVMRFLDPDENG